MNDLNVIWNDILNSFVENPRDVATSPSTKALPRWYSVYVQGNRLYVARGTAHARAAAIAKPRELHFRELSVVYSLYLKRKSGKAISKEERNLSYNLSYWFGIFTELNL